ncbi:MAG TPA: glycosyltransferase family 4 protein [bacterium]|nr:glycosyltransferase family 4 protein [bacterium]
MTESIRIARVITRLNIGGPSRHVMTLTSALNDGRFRSRLICGIPTPNEGDLTAEARAGGYPLVQIRALRNDAGLIAALATMQTLYREFRTMRPHIVHLHQFKARFLGALAARAAGVPHVVQTYHGTLLQGYFLPPLATAVTLLERLLGRWLVHHTIAISPEVCRQLVERGMVDPHRITVIRLGLSLTPLLTPPESGDAFRREIDIPTDALLIGFVGRLAPIKGADLFLEAAEELIRTMERPVYAVIVGDGPERQHLEAQARRAAIDSRIIFTGWRRDLRAVYWGIDVLAVTSRSEGTPVVAMEAMAARRAVVATRVGGIPDIIQDGRTGLLIEPGNPQRLAAALQQVLEDVALRQRLGLAAQQSVYPAYDETTLCRAMREYYARLLEG